PSGLCVVRVRPGRHAPRRPGRGHAVGRWTPRRPAPVGRRPCGPCGGALDPRDRLAERARPTTGRLSAGPTRRGVTVLPRVAFFARGAAPVAHTNPHVSTRWRQVRGLWTGASPWTTRRSGWRARPLCLERQAAKANARLSGARLAKRWVRWVTRNAVHDLGSARRRLALVGGALVMAANPAWPRLAGDPVRLVWDEGDV